MSIAQFVFAVPFTILSSDVLLVATSFGGCEGAISSMEVHMYVAFCQFSKNPPNFISVADVMTFFMISHSTSTALLYIDITVISVLEFGPKTNIHLL